MDANKLFLEHFEKLALAIAGIVLALFVITTAIKEQPADQMRAKVAAANNQIKAKMEKATQNAPNPKALTYAKDLTTVLYGGGEPQAMPSWLFHKRPVIVTKIEGFDVPEPKHFEPSIDTPASGLGRIGCTWAENTGDNLVKIDKYELFRAEGAPEKGWKSIATFDGTKLSHVDTNVQTKVDYFYKVVSTASVDDSNDNVKKARAKGGIVALPDDMRVRESVVAGPIRTKADVYVEVVNVVLKTTPDEIRRGVAQRTPSAYVNVWKYFPAKKEWLRMPYTEVKIDERIGKEDHQTDFILLETKQLRVKKPFGEVDADAIGVKDVRTGEPITFNNQELPQELLDIKKNPKPTDEGGAPDDKAGDKKKDNK